MRRRIFVFSFALLMWHASAVAQSHEARIVTNWQVATGTLQAEPTYQIVASALMRPSSPIHDRVYQNLHDIHANYARFQGWYPYPRLAVAELKPPSNGKTYWDFSFMDPLVVDFLNATKGHPTIMNIATIPAWMYKTDEPVSAPSDPNQLDRQYEQGTELRDPSMREVSEYFKRVASWYIKGGFTDEYGKWHESGHHYKLTYWEVLNEVDHEHQTTPETYTRMYDAIVEAVREVDPSIKFIGLGLGGISSPYYFQYFLNPANHKAGIPIDGISYHFYANWSPNMCSASVFEQADRFVSVVRYIEAIREELAPTTKSFIDEVGFISDDDKTQYNSEHISNPLPDSYWNLAASFYAYLFVKLSQFPGIQAVGMSSGLGFPNHYYPSVTMMDWRTGQPNARYWALKLLIDHMTPGSEMAHTEVMIHHKKSSARADIQVQALIRPDHQREILVINRADQPYEIVVDGADGGEVSYVDQSTNFHPAATMPLISRWVDPSPLNERENSQDLMKDRFILQGFGVAVVTLPRSN